MKLPSEAALSQPTISLWSASGSSAAEGRHLRVLVDLGLPAHTRSARSARRRRRTRTSCARAGRPASQGCRSPRPAPTRAPAPRATTRPRRSRCARAARRPTSAATSSADDEHVGDRRARLETRRQRDHRHAVGAGRLGQPAAGRDHDPRSRRARRPPRSRQASPRCCRSSSRTAPPSSGVAHERQLVAADRAAAGASAGRRARRRRGRRRSRSRPCRRRAAAPRPSEAPSDALERRPTRPATARPRGAAASPARRRPSCSTSTARSAPRVRPGIGAAVYWPATSAVGRQPSADEMRTGAGPQSPSPTTVSSSSRAPAPIRASGPTMLSRTTAPSPTTTPSCSDDARNRRPAPRPGPRPRGSHPGRPRASGAISQPAPTSTGGVGAVSTGASRATTCVTTVPSEDVARGLQVALAASRCPASSPRSGRPYRPVADQRREHLALERHRAPAVDRGRAPRARARTRRR